MKGYRTIVANVIAMLLAFLAWPQITEVIPAQYVPILMGVLNLALRYVTTTPVGQSTPT